MTIMLPTRPLGHTGLHVTQLGYGSMGLRGPRTWGVRVVDESDAERFLNLVLDSGINFIDTSPDYGICEERIGRYLRSRRSEYVLATKCGCVYTQHEDHLQIDHVWDKEVIKRNLHTSLERMRTDYIDVLQFHGGDADTLVRQGLIDQLASFRDQGLVKCIGVSSKLPELKSLIELEVFDTFQIPYSCLAPEHGDCIQQAAEIGAAVIVRGGVAQGGPDAEIQRPALNDVWSQAKLDQVLPTGMSRAQLILRYTLSHPGVTTTIVGTCNDQHLTENIAAAKAGPLSEDLRAEIAARVRLAIKK
ncbi:aldo/keto reductase [Novipirellula artificiosorum]|uniref:General stress protein 69 n=1 Tax=Novipirellula artificiosorum TaxID=2528016 RepID=A0A5C6E4V7_9BACT|nr:aldo/keto reductase [Novipirellula artificiosorum]TWU42189.1 General stress protein 69 [Novipirellula artificiosorum]